MLYLYPQVQGNRLGAEELDLLAGLKIIEKNNLLVYSISINLQDKKIDKPEIYKTAEKFSYRSYIRWRWIRLTTPDNSLKQVFTFKNYIAIQRFIRENEIRTVITNTNSMVLFGRQNNVKHIFRSVNYEPLHVLAEVENRPLSLLLFLIKRLCLYREMQADIIWCVSPRDAEHYKKHLRRNSKTDIRILPLRQFHYPVEFETKKQGTFLNACFLGSTYTVLHNRRSLDFILSEFDFLRLTQENIKVNIYGRKANLTTDGDNPQIRGWAADIEEIYKENQIFLIPYFGGGRNAI